MATFEALCPIYKFIFHFMTIKSFCHNISPWKFKVKVMAKVKLDGHICICSVAITPFFGWDMTNSIWYLTLKIQGQGHGENQTKSNQVTYRSFATYFLLFVCVCVWSSLFQNEQDQQIENTNTKNNKRLEQLCHKSCQKWKKSEDFIGSCQKSAAKQKQSPLL